MFTVVEVAAPVFLGAGTVSAFLEVDVDAMLSGSAAEVNGLFVCAIYGLNFSRLCADRSSVGEA